MNSRLNSCRTDSKQVTWHDSSCCRPPVPRRRYSGEASTMFVATARTAVPGCQVSQALLAASTVAQDDTICCKESRQPRTCYIRRHASNTVTRACTTVAAVLRYERRLALTRALTSRARKQPMTNRKPKSETLTAKPTRLSYPGADAPSDPSSVVSR